MKVMISYPPLSSSKRTPLLSQNRQFQWFHHHTVIYPLVMASAATLLSREKNTVIWNDCIARRWEYKRFVDLFKELNPDLLIMETKTPVVKIHWQIIQELKSLRPKTNFVLLGDHVTARPGESMERCPVDYIITGGDYDLSLLKLVRFIEGSSHQRSMELPPGIWMREGNRINSGTPFELFPDLDSLPFIDRDLSQWYLYGEKIYKRTPFTYTMAGRDCPWGRCSFCAWTSLYPKFRVRSPENLLNEIGILIRDYGIREIFDDTGTFPGNDWLKKFCQGMIKRGYHQKILFSTNFRFDYLKQDIAYLMKKSGFRLLKLGLESANQETLDRLRKGIKVSDILQGLETAKKARLEIHLTVMVGYPWETEEMFENTFRMVRSLMRLGMVDTLQSTIIIPYPGTLLYDQAESEGWWRIDPFDYERYDMTESILKTEHIHHQKVTGLCHRFYRLFLDPVVIFHHLTYLKSLEGVRYLVRGLWAVIGHLQDFLK